MINHRFFLCILLVICTMSRAYPITIDSSNANTLGGFNSSYYLNSSNQNAGTLPSSRIIGVYTGITKVGTISTFNATGKMGLNFPQPSGFLDIVASPNTFIIRGLLSTDTSKMLFGVQQSTAGNGNLFLSDNTGTFRSVIAGSGTSYFNAGNVGINTTLPQRKLSVVGDIQCTGNIYESNFAQGEMFVSYNTTAMNLVSASTYYTVTQNVVTGDLTNFTFTNSGTDAYLTCGKDGLYAFIGTISFSGGNADEFHCGLSVNNANPLGCCEFNRKMGAGGDVGSAAFSGVIRLSATNTLRVKVKNETDTDDPVVQFMNFSIYRIAP